MTLRSANNRMGFVLAVQIGELECCDVLHAPDGSARPGLRTGWWGDGVGDGWQYAAVPVTVVGLLGSLLGVSVGRFLARILRH